jgi:hypothetical protein
MILLYVMSTELIDILFFNIFQYYTVTGLPGKRLDPNICAVCGNQILVTNNEDAIIETTCKLQCDHVYPLIQNNIYNYNIPIEITYYDTFVTSYNFKIQFRYQLKLQKVTKQISAHTSY